MHFEVPTAEGAIVLVVLLFALGRFIHAGDQRRWFDAEPFDSREPGG